MATPPRNPRARPIVKVCGVTSVADAEGCVAAGADWLGLNFVPASPRCIDVARAREIREAVGGRAIVVGVTADMTEEALLALMREVQLDRLQLHGDETPELVRALAPRAYKALRVGSVEDAARADAFEGLLLVDAKVEGALGGTGRLVDLALAASLARARPVLLAGGLRPSNVGDAIRAVSPFGVDVASGVERAPGVKDLDAVAAFVTAARRASGP